MLSKYLDKDPKDFQRKDLMKFIKEKDIKFIHLRYPAGDGRLKTLKFPISSYKRAEQILGDGERVDGSSLFKSILDPAKSDIYVVPIYETAFINPFYKDTIDICCRFLDQKGNFEKFTPPSILMKASSFLKDKFNIELYALAELEFYLLKKIDNNLMYPANFQQGYHEAEPFIKNSDVFHEIVSIISQCIPRIKYAHSEVGFISFLQSKNREINNTFGEQYEVEFLPTSLERAALDVLIAKWIIRNVAYKNGIIATFAPKLEEGVAGSGMHIHIELRKDNKNIMQEGNKLSKYAKCAIGGLCKYATSLTAFGNTVASSYLRLVPHQEAPTKVFWSENNRAALIREPLGWGSAKNLGKKVNPQEQEDYFASESRQTIELRSPDGSADIFLLLSGIALAVGYGLEEEKGIEIAEKYYIGEKLDINSDTYKKLPFLPTSCEESADILNKNRKFYEKIIPSIVIDNVIKKLHEQQDKEVYNKLQSLPTPQRLEFSRDIMHRFIHIG